jgi:3-phosphoglycerate kinase
MKILSDYKIRNKKVVLRLDLNIPIIDNKVLSADRIYSAVPVIKYLLSNHNQIRIISHLGNPNGSDKNLTLFPLVKYISNLLHEKVDFFNHHESDFISQPEFSNAKIIIFENLRFHSGEETNDPKYAKKLADLGEIYINEAFSVSHRTHASIVGITKYIPSYAGFHFAHEVEILHNLINKPKHPFTAIIGGAKTKDKIKVIRRLIEIADNILVTGCIGNTFLKATGFNIGISRYDSNLLQKTADIFKLMEHLKKDVIIPIDFVVIRDSHNIICQSKMIKKTDCIMDIGPDSLLMFQKYIANSGTVLLNGPAGRYEESPFHQGTQKIIKFISQSKATTIIGGGDTIASIPNRSIYNKITHVSTGGGAMLKFIETGSLPGIEVL